MCSGLLLLHNFLLKFTNDVLKTWLFPQNLSSLFMKINSIVSKMLSSGDDDYCDKIKDISMNCLSMKILAFVIWKFRQLLYKKIGLCGKGTEINTM